METGALKLKNVLVKLKENSSKTETFCKIFSTNIVS